MKNNYLLREIAGEYMLVPLGNSCTSLNAMITFNETGAFIWKKLEEDLTNEQIAQAFTCDYNVTYQQALEDVEEFVAYLKEKNII
ncbi:MAG: PqqD family protein [Acutalibacteraceae bacterium]|nr:PqqD family protein [Acutalibacteraceae bacterium]